MMMMMILMTNLRCGDYNNDDDDGTIMFIGLSLIIPSHIHGLILYPLSNIWV